MGQTSKSTEVVFTAVKGKGDAWPIYIYYWYYILLLLAMVLFAHEVKKCKNIKYLWQNNLSFQNFLVPLRCQLSSKRALMTTCSCSQSSRRRASRAWERLPETGKTELSLEVARIKRWQEKKRTEHSRILGQLLHPGFKMKTSGTLADSDDLSRTPPPPPPASSCVHLSDMSPKYISTVVG